MFLLFLKVKNLKNVLCVEKYIIKAVLSQKLKENGNHRERGCCSKFCRSIGLMSGIATDKIDYSDYVKFRKS